LPRGERGNLGGGVREMFRKEARQRKKKKEEGKEGSEEPGWKHENRDGGHLANKREKGDSQPLLRAKATPCIRKPLPSTQKYGLKTRRKRRTGFKTKEAPK